MKKVIFGTALLLLSAALLFAEIRVPFYRTGDAGSPGFETSTTFASDLNNGATGLDTTVGFSLWFVYMPWQDRGVAPTEDDFTVQLRFASSASFGWMGFGQPDDKNGYYFRNGYGTVEWVNYDAVQIYCEDFFAQVQYKQFWLRLTGIQPHVTMSQASIRSVFDPIMKERTASDKNVPPFPLFNAGSDWNNSGIISVIGRDLVHLNRREVVIAGNLFAGMDTDLFDLVLKAASWKPGAENVDNSWIGGFDFSLKPADHTINLSFLGAVNYDSVEVFEDDPMSDPDALKENPFAVGLGYDYQINLPRRRMIRPYIGVDYIYENSTNEYDYEIGGGFQWYYRGRGAQFKRNAFLDRAKLGDIDVPAAITFGINVNKDNVINAVFGIAEEAAFSPIPKVGGFVQLEFMNIGGKKYPAPDGKVYDDFLWAGVIQVDYQLTEKIIPYVFARYLPAIYSGDVPIFHKDNTTITTRIGCRIYPFDKFAFDVCYERNDRSIKDKWEAENGLLLFTFGISL